MPKNDSGHFAMLIHVQYDEALLKSPTQQKPAEEAILKANQLPLQMLQEPVLCRNISHDVKTMNAVLRMVGNKEAIYINNFFNDGQSEPF